MENFPFFLYVAVTARPAIQTTTYRQNATWTQVSEVTHHWPHCFTWCHGHICSILHALSGGICCKRWESWGWELSIENPEPTRSVRQLCSPAQTKGSSCGSGSVEPGCWVDPATMNEPSLPPGWTAYPQSNTLKMVKLEEERSWAWDFS